MNSSHAPNKRNHDRKGSKKTTTENPIVDGQSPASREEKFEGLHESRPHILKLFARIEHLHEEVDVAFAGQPFLPHVPPEAPANRRRFNVYLEQNRQVTKLLSQALELWMTSYGLKPGENWIPLLVEEMRQKGLQENRPPKS